MSVELTHHEGIMSNRSQYCWFNKCFNDALLYRLTRASEIIKNCFKDDAFDDFIFHSIAFYFIQFTPQCELWTKYWFISRFWCDASHMIFSEIDLWMPFFNDQSLKKNAWFKNHQLQRKTINLHRCSRYLKAAGRGSLNSLRREFKSFCCRLYMISLLKAFIRNNCNIQHFFFFSKNYLIKLFFSRI